MFFISVVFLTEFRLCKLSLRGVPGKVEPNGKKFVLSTEALRQNLRLLLVTYYYVGAASPIQMIDIGLERPKNLMIYDGVITF